ncbi:MAG: hypothetical protein RIT04_686 [Candidatus Parcubacteria bacterium]|jgi:hypothetical protein
MNHNTKYSRIAFPQDLEQHIVRRIHNAERTAARRHFFGLGAVALASLTSLVPITSYLSQALTKSGAYEYISLILSDGTTLVTYWRELSISIAESLPVFGFAVLLGVTALFLWSLGKTVRDARGAFMTTQTI